MNCWKCVSFPIFVYIMYNCIYGGSVLCQNIFTDYFYKMNCSFSHGVVLKTYNNIQCASICLSDELCEGFQAVRIDSRLTECYLFNITSARYIFNSDKQTFIKTYLLSKVSNINKDIQTLF
jgi:hypothetical protein